MREISMKFARQIMKDIAPMTPKEQYRILCTQEPTIPLFMQHWWMEAVCVGKHWDVLLVRRDGQIVAAMPYLCGKKLGMKYILMPQQTQINGIWLKPGYEPEAAALAAEFAAQLKAMHLAYYYQQYPIGSPFPAILAENGFAVKERVTYRIEDISDMDRVVASFSQNKKRQLKKAAGLQVDFGMTADEFYRFHTAALAERGRTISYPPALFMALCAAACSRRQGQIIALRNAKGTPLAAAFIVWDAAAAYLLIPVYSPAHAKTGASARVVLEAIKHAQGKARAFDFEGSMDSGIANSYRQFGSTAAKYYSVERCFRGAFRMLLAGKKMLEWKRN